MKKDDIEKKPIPWEVSDPALPLIRAEHRQAASDTRQEK